MSTLVLDASVAAKWFLPAEDETLVPQALDLMARHAKSELRFIVPGIFWAEMGNIFWKAVRARRCPRQYAEESAASLQEKFLTTVSSRELMSDALAIAITFDRTVYDSLYVALAVSHNAPLVTADERLANALAARFPVKWLGAF